MAVVCKEVDRSQVCSGVRHNQEEAVLGRQVNARKQVQWEHERLSRRWTKERR